MASLSASATAPQASAQLRAADIHARIADGWPSILMQLGIGEEFLRGKKKPGPCPACGGTDRFFFDNRTGRGDFHCRQCGASDGFALLERVHGWNFSEARKRVMQAANLAEVESERTKARQVALAGTRPTLEPHGSKVETGGTAEIISKKLGISENTVQRASADPLEWSDKAESIWRRTQPLRGTFGQTYLERRGCVLPPRDSHLRFLPASGKYPPSLCAAVTDARTAKPISLHFTRLAADGHRKAGTKQDKLLLASHRKKGGVIRLWPDEAVTYGLLIAEGVETALAAAHAYTPVWSTVDAGNLASLPVLSGIESLVIVADHDSAGINAAQECARRWAAAGCQVRIARPKTPGADAADVGVAA